MLNNNDKYELHDNNYQFKNRLYGKNLKSIHIAKYNTSGNIDTIYEINNLNIDHIINFTMEFEGKEIEFFIENLIYNNIQVDKNGNKSVVKFYRLLTHIINTVFRIILKQKKNSNSWHSNYIIDKIKTLYSSLNTEEAITCQSELTKIVMDKHC